MSKLSSRVDDLERKSGGSDVKAVWYDDSELLAVVGSGEQMTPGEFELLYPDGTIIHVVHVKRSREDEQA